MERGARYREWTVRPEMVRLVVCAWAGRFADSGAPHTERVLPDGCIDLIWNGTRLMVAGPNTRAFTLEPRPGAAFAGVRFRPGVAPAVLGAPAAALLNRHVEAGDVLGAPRVAELVDALAAAPSFVAAARVLEGAVAAWLPATRPPDPLVWAAVRALRASPGAHPIAHLARALGAGERQVHRRFVAAVGYGPKTLHRIMRLRRFLGLAGGPGAPRGLSALAVEAGYADQAHLARECLGLTGVSPSRLTGTLLVAA